MMQPGDPWDVTPTDRGWRWRCGHPGCPSTGQVLERHSPDALTEACDRADAHTERHARAEAEVQRVREETRT